MVNDSRYIISYDNGKVERMVPPYNPADDMTPFEYRVCELCFQGYEVTVTECFSWKDDDGIEYDDEIENVFEPLDYNQMLEYLPKDILDGQLEDYACGHCWYKMIQDGDEDIIAEIMAEFGEDNE